MTLKALGVRAGLSHPFLSQLERGLARPSVGSVERIALALDVPVRPVWSAPARRGNAEMLTPSAGSVAPHPYRSPGAVRTLPLGPGRSPVREWTGGSRRWPDGRHTEQAELLIYIARGALEVDLDGEVYALEEGDTLVFDGAVPHRLRRTGGVNTRALVLATG